MGPMTINIDTRHKQAHAILLIKYHAVILLPRLVIITINLFGRLIHQQDCPHSIT